MDTDSPAAPIAGRDERILLHELRNQYLALVLSNGIPPNQLTFLPRAFDDFRIRGRPQTKRPYQNHCENHAREEFLTSMTVRPFSFHIMLYSEEEKVTTLTARRLMDF